MAIAIHSRRRHVTHRPPLMRHRTTESNAALPLIVVVLLAIGVTALLVSSQMLEISVPRSLIPAMQPAAPSRPTDGAVPVSKMSVSPVAEHAAVAPAAPADPTLRVLVVGARSRVANTDNLGVVFYAAPREGARQPAGLLEGTTVTVLELSGDEWARVQSDLKKSGWVRARYLVPAE
jgi:hypothetical protein